MSGVPSAVQTAKRAVVQVGYGRGFVVSAGEYGSYVITAAHCLPRWRYPYPHLANSTTELTFPRIIGALGSKRKEQTIWAELCSISLTDDIAAFSEPDDQELCDQCEQYQAFAETAITIGNPPAIVPPYQWDETPRTVAFVLSLDGEWQTCTVHNGGRFLAISDGAECIKGGMSGSPIINSNGAAIGLVSTGGGDDGGFNMHPSLGDCLPSWLLRKLKRRGRP